MREYLKYLAIRVVAGFLVMALFYFGNKLTVDTPALEECDNIDLLILGDSHFNGLALPNALHRGQDSDTYFTMYNKLVSTSHSCKINGVVVSLSYINLSSNYFDSFLRSDANQSYSLASRNMSYSNLFRLMKEGISWRSVIKVFARNKFSFNDESLASIFANKESGFEGYPKEYVFDSLKDIERLRIAQVNKKRKIRVASPGYKKKIQKSIERLFIVDQGKVSTWNLKYLNKIVEYCQVNSLKLYLVNTPLETSYNKLIPSKFKEALAGVVKDVALENSNVRYVDLTNYFKSPEYFLDEHHVTQYGAALISEEIRRTMVN